MRDIPVSASQVANSSGASFADAQLATYMAAVSDSWSLHDFSQKTGIPMSACRDAAYRWGVQFSDYDPFAKPRTLAFVKADKGWKLFDGEDEIGECLRDPDGKYYARLFSQTNAVNWKRKGAMLDLARQIDAMSPDLDGFNGKPVRVVERTEAGLRGDVIFPATDEKEVGRCRDALDFRATLKAAA